MAIRGSAFFDAKGQFFKTAEDATISDLAAVLGRVGDGESLAPGIAKTLYEQRAHIERIFAEHDNMVAAKVGTKLSTDEVTRQAPKLVADGTGKVTPLHS
jgi:hypothetical protein